ncbi:hypothetical protein GCM10027416_16760 [Okibacterium endophyticum]
MSVQKHENETTGAAVNELPDAHGSIVPARSEFVGEAWWGSSNMSPRAMFSSHVIVSGKGR